MQIEPMRYNLQEIKDVMQSRGFEYVDTAAGPITIEEWHPYGGHHATTWQAEIISEDQVRDWVPGTTKGFVLGVWTFIRLGAVSITRMRLATYEETLRHLHVCLAQYPYDAHISLYSLETTLGLRATLDYAVLYKLVEQGILAVRDGGPETYGHTDFSIVALPVINEEKD